MCFSRARRNFWLTSVLKISVLKLLLALFHGLLLLSLGACQSQTVVPEWNWQRAETGLPRQAIVTSVSRQGIADSAEKC